VESSREEHENSRWGGGHDRRPLPALGSRSRGSRRAARCVALRCLFKERTSRPRTSTMICSAPR
jgi:hypothetical protein